MRTKSFLSGTKNEKWIKKESRRRKFIKDWEYIQKKKIITKYNQIIESGKYIKVIVIQMVRYIYI